jgi:hypothetical protein
MIASNSSHESDRYASCSGSLKAFSHSRVPHGFNLQTAIFLEARDLPLAPVARRFKLTIMTQVCVLCTQYFTAGHKVRGLGVQSAQSDWRGNIECQILQKVEKEGSALWARARYCRSLSFGGQVITFSDAHNSSKLR